MNKQLDTYFSDITAIAPPQLSAQKLQDLLEERAKRRRLVAVSFAALLWVMMFVVLTLVVYRLSPVAAYVLAGLLGAGIVAAGIFSGLVLKFMKVGTEA